MEEGIHIALSAEPVAHFLGLPITNTLLTAWVVMAFLIVVGYFVGRKLEKIPGRLQTLFEAFFGFALDYLEELLESKSLARKLFPIVATLFFFILIANWIGLLPGVNSIGVLHEDHGETTLVSLLYPVATDLNFTLALAFIAFLTIEVLGVTTIGVLKYGSKFVNFKSPIGFFVGLVELVSELARLITYSFRLFGNIFAGKVLLLVVMFFIPYIAPVPLLAYEVFVGFIQAAVFAMLTVVFVKIAVAESH